MKKSFIVIAGIFYVFGLLSSIFIFKQAEILDFKRNKLAFRAGFNAGMKANAKVIIDSVYYHLEYLGNTEIDTFKNERKYQ